jgi:hypothetical protein
MKLKFLSSIVFIIILTSCSLNSDNNTEPQIIRTEWHLRNVAGGIDGVNNNFALNTIIWTFNESSNILNVINNNTNTSLEDGFDSGIYSYSLLDNVNKAYISISQTEFGSISVLDKQLIIDQNEKSTGGGADGYIYTFQLVEIIE